MTLDRNYYYHTKPAVSESVPGSISSDIVIACGAECGVGQIGNGNAQDRHWGLAQGVTSVSTSVKRTGTAAFEMAAAATAPYIARLCASSKTIGYFRGYFRVTNATPSAAAYLIYVATGASNMRIQVSTGGVVQALVNGGGTQNGPTISADTWYGLECQFDCSGTTHSIKWRVEVGGTWTDYTDSTGASSASSLTSIRFGLPGGVTSGTTHYWDDILIGEGTTDGRDFLASGRSGQVLRYLPNADMSHSLSTGDFKYDNSTNVSPSATDVYTYLDDSDQTASAEFISQNVAGSPKYISCAFADEATLTPTHVAVSSRHNALDGNTSEFNLRVSDDGSNWSNLWGDWSTVGYSTSTAGPIYLHKVLPNTPSGHGWTRTSLNGMRFQWGNSDTVSPAPPYLAAICLEAEFPS